MLFIREAMINMVYWNRITNIIYQGGNAVALYFCIFNIKAGTIG